MSNLRMGLCGKLGKGIGLSTFPPLDSFFSFPLFPASPQAPPPSARLLQFFRGRLFRSTSRLSRKGLLALQAVAARTQLP